MSRICLNASFFSLLLAGLLGLPARALPPLSAEIVIDGAFGDWSEVLSSPANTARDGYGAVSDCSLSSDADCRVVGIDHDLERMAWTFDARSLFLYVERFEDRPSSESIHVYLDLDRNGLLEAGEPVLDVQPDQPRGTAITLLGYQPAQPGGDPTTRGGIADGYTLPGTATLSGPFVGDLLKSVPDGAFELALTWAELGMAGPRAVDARVSAGSGGIPGGVRDNIGALDGGPVSTAFAAVSLQPAISQGAAPGGTLRLRHRVGNEGTLEGALLLEARSRIGYDIGWYLDLDGDGLFEDLAAWDAGGDGILDLPGDSLSPVGDRDGDGKLDSGLLAPFESVEFELEQSHPAGSDGVVEEITVRATHPVDSSVQAELVDVLRLGLVSLFADAERVGVAGDLAWFPHVVESRLPAPQVVDFSTLSGRGWAWDLFEDPTGDGDPQDAVPLTDTDLSSLPDLTLAPGERRYLLARVSIPAGTPLATVEIANLAAVVSGAPRAVVSDSLEVVEPLSLAPDYLLTEGQARHGGAGGSIYFAHRLRQALGRSVTIVLAALSDRGWAVDLLSDPDGDGRPWDARPLASPFVRLGPNGDELPFLLRVRIPAGTALNEISRVSLTALVQTDPSISASAADDAVVSIVRVYEDPLHAWNLQRAAPCSTVHALASGLPPGVGGYRFSWLDPLGNILRVQDVATDFNGETEDSRGLAPTEIGAGWAVELSWNDGTGWAALDRAVFEIGDGLELESLVLENDPAPLIGAEIAGRAEVANPSFDQPTGPVTLRWVVLSPDGGSYLDPSGAFLPYGGSEGTQLDLVDLPARTSRSLSLQVSGVDHREAGLHAVELWRSTGCGGGESLVATAPYEVIDDEDGDGLSRDEEIAAGTDPLDADSDDDGLPDGEDGLEDSDGDGIIDALDCDSDDDGLGDGLESGIYEPGPDTDLAAGCFRPDAWPIDQTDPDRADSDGGGVPDGIEDADGDGRIDPGEGDPRDPADDAALCDAARPPELGDLRLTREGVAARLAWTALPPDACLSYAVLAAPEPSAFELWASGLREPSHRDDVPLAPALLRFYLVRGDSAFAGEGPTGR